MGNNLNRIVTNTWSNPDSRKLHELRWPAETACRQQYSRGEQCGGCSFFAPLNVDWGICAHRASRHYLETVFEHFTCPNFVQEGWGSHSFTESREFHCNCKAGAENE